MGIILLTYQQDIGKRKQYKRTKSDRGEHKQKIENDIHDIKNIRMYKIFQNKY